ncbi:MAG TPA: DUF4410 domain-containing protein [Pararobbsia sp.]|nr:DUF4410 domain-containing protein [Pararobbsia sp.]
MSTSWNIPGAKWVRRVGGVLVLSCALFSGCASGSVTSMSEQAVPSAAQPQVIYVSAFDVDANDVKVDRGGAMKQMKASIEGTTQAQQQVDTAAQARDDVANEIVANLQHMGLHAVRLEGPVPAGQNALVVTGRIEAVDEGNRRRRVLIGLGAGKSEEVAAVQFVYVSANGATQVVQSFNASADSGKAPGFAETAGVGAAVGHVATAAAAGTGLHAVSEKQRSSVSGESKHLADAIAKQVKELGAAQGWSIATQS